VALGSDAFTYGSDIYYASGRGPGADLVTAHELGHVTQQRTALRSGGGRAKQIQRIGAGTFPVTNGFFELDMQTRQGKTGPPGDHIGLDGYLRFLPKVGAPNSNVIVFTQIAKLTDLAGKDIDAATDSAGWPGAARQARGSGHPDAGRRAARRRRWVLHRRDARIRRRAGGTGYAVVAGLRRERRCPGHHRRSR
jgi:hypothetical protein